MYSYSSRILAETEQARMRRMTTNDYWDEVKHHVTRDHPFGRPVVDWWTNPHIAPNRAELTSRYSWTITDPASVQFVVDHVGTRVLDPMAGSGWWCRLLGEAGVDVLAYDLTPPGHGDNRWHRAGVAHVDVHQGDGVRVAAEHGAGRTLLLSWPPCDSPAGADILNAYPGGRVVYIGEPFGGNCGDDRLFELLRSGWIEVAEWHPVRWQGMHDLIVVYDRRCDP